MSTHFLDIALECARRGWFVFPLVPNSKRPATVNGKDAATVDEAKIRDWWGRQNPNFNVGIATGPSGLCVLDADHGLLDKPDWGAWAERNGIPSTYAVRSGRRDSYGVQMYFTGSAKDGKFDLDGVSGDIKSAGGYVLAAGCIHPDSRQEYKHIHGVAPCLLPGAVLTLARRSREQAAAPDDGQPITENRNSRLTSIAGKLRNAGLSAAALEAALLQVNEDRCDPPLPDSEVQRIAANASKWEIPADALAVTLGAGKGQTKNEARGAADDSHGAQEGPNTAGWRALFHTIEDFDGAPEPSFLIDRFLQEQSITGLIGPARARKSIVTVNIMHALLTGEPLFGKFEVTMKPERVVYLCPESGLLSTAKRLRNMGLRDYIADDRLLFTSMNNERAELLDPRMMKACANAVIFVDTAIRFFNGSENEASDMSLFAEHCQTLMRVGGAKAMVLLHHTKKGAEGITLEGGRGSGDFGGFLTCCWGTGLDDYEDAYNSHSLMKPVKERDFKGESFKLAPSGDETNFFLQYVEGSENTKVQVGAKPRADQAKALAYVRANAGMSAEALSRSLAEQGVAYSPTWCRNTLRAIKRATSSSNS